MPQDKGYFTSPVRRATCVARATSLVSKGEGLGRLLELTSLDLDFRNHFQHAGHTTGTHDPSASPRPPTSCKSRQYHRAVYYLNAHLGIPPTRPLNTTLTPTSPARRIHHVQLQALERPRLRAHMAYAGLALQTRQDPPKLQDVRRWRLEPSMGDAEKDQDPAGRQLSEL